MGKRFRTTPYGIMECDEYGMIMTGRPALDWCDVNCEGRTPRAHPYSYDDHYIFRSVPKNKRGGIDNAEAYYTDRMREWDREKANRAMEGFVNYGAQPMSFADAKRAAKTYFGDDVECVAYALSCNHSSGYPLGVFFIRRK